MPTSKDLRNSKKFTALVGRPAPSAGIIQGVEPQALRDNGVLRDTVASELSELQSSLDDLLVDRPRRRILRRPTPQREAA
jgi:hypothetical protein